jgi:RNA 2',3'-cyclic 3'-phosphodiesterase
VSGDEQLRLFCALRLPCETVDALAAWQLANLHGGRVVPRENLHVTLAFLGSRPAADAAAVARELVAAAAAAGAIVFGVGGYRETRSVGMLTLDDAGGRAAALAEDVQGRLEGLGLYTREQRAWRPHVTALRFRERPRLSPPLPELGTFSPSDAAVFISRLRPGGARYEVLETASLGGR